MAQRGRKAKTAAVKAAQGNPGKRPVAAPTPALDPVPSVLGAVPRNLSKEGRAVWNELAPQLAAMRFIRQTDRPAFARYCEALGEFWKVTARLRKEKSVYETETRHGKMKRVHPLFAVQTILERRLEALEDRFGLNPQARQNIMLRLAAAPPLFPTDPKDDDGTKDQAQETPAPSPIGFLNPAMQI